MDSSILTYQEEFKILCGVRMFTVRRGVKTLLYSMPDGGDPNIPSSKAFALTCAIRRLKHHNLQKKKEKRFDNRISPWVL